MMSRFRKFAIGVGIALTSVALLSGCGKTSSGTGSASSHKTVVTIWGDDPNFNVPIMKTAVKMYNQEHKNSDVTFKVEMQNDYVTKLQTVLSAGKQSNFPNIVSIEDYNAQKLLSSYQNDFQPLQNINLKNFSSYKKDIVRYQGKTYGVPFDSGVSALYYRKDIFAKYGVTAKDLNNITWDQFIKLAEKVKQSSGKEILGTGTLLGQDPDMIRQILQSTGNWYFTKSGKLNINSTGFKKTIETIKSLHDAGVITGYSDFNSRNKAVYNGKLLGLVEGAWYLPTLKADKKLSGKWGIATVPRVSGMKNASNTTNEGGSSYYVLNTGNTKADKAAKKFLKTMFDGNSKFYAKALKEQAAVTTYKPAKTNKEWNQTDPFLNQKVNKYFADNMDKIPSVSYGTHSVELETIFQSDLGDYYNGKKSLNSTIKTMEAAYKSQVGGK
ncbi:ABC transporter substrate-binding protein [Pediococcus siamensis]|uniref:ABC transporter substrate-binding protein n=1 Tax=Pediococcus siamensis TaxID=381829 RepID=UPI0039A1F823